MELVIYNGEGWIVNGDFHPEAANRTEGLLPIPYVGSTIQTALSNIRYKQ